MKVHNPHCIVEIAGAGSGGNARFDSWKDEGLFKTVNVDLTTREASEATVEFHDPRFVYQDKFATASGVTRLRSKVWIGYGADLGQPVFDGLLASIERDTDATTYRFFDMGYLMRQIEETEYHKGLDDLGIIKKLAAQHNLEFEGPDKPVTLDKHKSTIQTGQTDWQYAQECAERSGFVLFVRGSKLYAKEAARSSTPVLDLVNKRDFRLQRDYSLRYRAPENQEGRPALVEARGRGRGGKRLQGKSEKSQRGGTRRAIKRDLAIRSKAHVDRRALSRKELQRVHNFTGSLNLLPSVEVRNVDVRQTIRILEVGVLFSGKYLVENVAHTFTPGQLTTKLDIYRDAVID
ncbi:MAG: hypothetical protein MSG64_07550 [Pyrinomonadaceae bacterium MAG19_C2-C3]|nr:hypothetical protein [Pyrinomonadaceae bacterium MAG19_C2-C3]